MTLHDIIQRDARRVFQNTSWGTAELVTHYPQGDPSRKRTFSAQVFADNLEGRQDQPGDGRQFEVEHARLKRDTVLIEVPTSVTVSFATNRPCLFEFLGPTITGTYVAKAIESEDSGMKTVVCVKTDVRRTRGAGVRSE